MGRCLWVDGKSVSGWKEVLVRRREGVLQELRDV